MTRISLLCLTIALLGPALNLQTGSAQEKKHGGLSISTGPEKVITDCSQIRIVFRGAEMARSEQAQAVSISAGSSLQVQAPHHGGIQVQGGSRGEYLIKACLAAAGDSSADAEKLLAQTSLSVRDGRVTVQGPSGESWVAYLIVEAPDGAVMDLESINGPIGISAVSGSIQARTLNGPITLYDVGGQVRASAQNGPINLRGSGGDLRLNAQNGPIGVELAGSRWESGDLEARTQNGPLTLTLPPEYQSPVRVETSKHSPVECRAIQCKQAVRKWDRPNLIEFGDSSPVVRLSTVNGPVTIYSTGDKR